MGSAGKKKSKRSNPGLYGSGLNREDWYFMKDAVGYASGSSKKFEIPEHLKDHEAAIHLQDYYNGKKRSLNKAAQALVPTSDQYWLVLMKS